MYYICKPILISIVSDVLFIGIHSARIVFLFSRFVLISIIIVISKAIIFRAATSRNENFKGSALRYRFFKQKSSHLAQNRLDNASS